MHLGFLAERLADGWQDEVGSLGCATIHLAASGLLPAESQAVRAAGLPLLLYTVNDPEEARRLRADGAFGLFTDRPDKVGLA
jgi:glycerophosphoryl diester phosphodiesterase